MSEITTRIQDYFASREGWDQLRDWLATRTYATPVRYLQGARDPYSDEEYPYTEGTWDEVDRTRNTGLLTAAEYLEIVQAADAHRAA